MGILYDFFEKSQGDLNGLIMGGIDYKAYAEDLKISADKLLILQRKLTNPSIDW